MSEEQTNETVSEEQEVPTEPVSTTGEPKTYTQEEMDRKFNNLVKQIQDYKDKDAAREDAARKAEEQKALKKGELEKVIQSKEDVIKELQSQLTARETEATVMQLESHLREAGVTDKMALLGWTSTYMSQEEKPDMAEWISKQKELSPESFKPAKNVVSTGAVGTVKQSGHNDSLEARLNSENSQVRLAAVREQFEKQMKGEMPVKE